jgi:exonuclease III
MVNLNIGTFNVKGLANDKKTKEIFYWLKEKKMNIYFLQETHCNNFCRFSMNLSSRRRDVLNL